MILKSFDLNCDYGPIIGISRSDRLKRAEYFNLTVSEDVKMILEDQSYLMNTLSLIRIFGTISRLFFNINDDSLL